MRMASTLSLSKSGICSYVWFLVTIILITSCHQKESASTPSIEKSITLNSYHGILDSLKTNYLEQYGATNNLMHFALYIEAKKGQSKKHDGIQALLLQEIINKATGWDALREDPIDYFVRDFDKFYNDRFQDSPYQELVYRLTSDIYYLKERVEMVDLQLQGLDNSTIQLSDFLGKVIVLDFWATWCKPCLEQMPYFEAIKKTYQDNDKVVFITVNADDKKDKWVKFVTSHNPINEVSTRLAGGMNDDQLTRVNVSDFPIYMIIDHKGYYVTMDGPRPESKSFNHMIKQELKSLN